MPQRRISCASRGYTHRVSRKLCYAATTLANSLSLFLTALLAVCVDRRCSNAREPSSPQPIARSSASSNLFKSKRRRSIRCSSSATKCVEAVSRVFVLSTLTSPRAVVDREGLRRSDEAAGPRQSSRPTREDPQTDQLGPQSLPASSHEARRRCYRLLSP